MMNRRSTKTRAKSAAVLPHSNWLLWFSHENGYLSWTRNAAICAGVGASVFMLGGSEVSATYFIGDGFLYLGLVFITVGSLQHIVSAVRLRKLAQITHPGLLWVALYTSGIWLVYWTLISDLKVDNLDLDSDQPTTFS